MTHFPQPSEVIDIAAANAALGRWCISITDKPWETSLFGKHVYSLELCGHGDEKGVADDGGPWAFLERLLAGSAPYMLSARIPASPPGWSASLESRGFHLMECYVELEHDLQILPCHSGNGTVRSVQTEDVSVLEDLARRAFSYSRFHMDPQIPRSAADESRAQWVGNACRGRADAVLVATQGGAGPVGFLVCRLSGRDGRREAKLDLMAVDPQYRGQGIGIGLTVAFLRLAHECGCSRAVVGTQAHNKVAMRTYVRAGFIPGNASLTYHKHVPAVRRPTFSIVMPFHNEAASLRELIPFLLATLENVIHDWELILVDDASTDNSADVARECSNEQSNIRIISLDQRGGQTGAFKVAFGQARGNYILRMDADLQDDPRDLPKFIAKMDQGSDLIVGLRECRKHSRVLRFASGVYDLLILALFDTPLHAHSGSYVAFRSDLVRSLPWHRNDHRYLPLIAIRRGARQISEVIARHGERKWGRSKYGPVRKLLFGVPEVLFFLLRLRSGVYDMARQHH